MFELLFLIGCGLSDKPAPAPPDSPEAEAPEAVAHAVTVPPSLSPGRIPTRRLNRDEYDQTVHDLLGTSSSPGAALFPSEATAAGFDTVADALVVSPVWLELADRAAAELAEEALQPPMAEPYAVTVDAAGGAFVLTPPDPGAAPGVLRGAGTASTSLDLPMRGTWHLAVTLSAEQLPPEEPHVVISANGLPLLSVLVGAQVGAPQVFEVDAPLPSGPVTVEVTFDNPYADHLGRARAVHVEAVSVQGPAEFTPGPSAPYHRVVICDLTATTCPRQVLEALVPRAWRRPVTEDEYQSLLAVYASARDLGVSQSEAMETAVHAVLVSPNFLFHVEPATAVTGEPVDDWTLASRLSYFLWGTMPDDALFALADAGTLHEPDVLVAQVERMLASPRSSVLVDAFAAQWLGIHRLDAAAPNRLLYSHWNEEVRGAMRAEMRAFFDTFVHTRRPMTELLTATEGYIDPVLAAFLEIPYDGVGLGTYDAARYHRGGWLGQAGLLTALSTPDRTSPVKRGAWILDALLCAPPAPPPPGVPALPPSASVPADMREALAEHRANPVCASCHDSIDPLGLPLEAMDAVGVFRGTGFDLTGATPAGVEVDGLAELSAALAADPAFFRCVAEKTFTWAHHRAPTRGDAQWVAQIAAAAEADGGSLAALISQIVQAPTFLSREGG